MNPNTSALRRFFNNFDRALLRGDHEVPSSPPSELSCNELTDHVLDLLVLRKLPTEFSDRIKEHCLKCASCAQNLDDTYVWTESFRQVALAERTEAGRRRKVPSRPMAVHTGRDRRREERVLLNIPPIFRVIDAHCPARLLGFAKLVDYSKRGIGLETVRPEAPEVFSRGTGTLIEIGSDFRRRYTVCHAAQDRAGLVADSARTTNDVVLRWVPSSGTPRPDVYLS